MNFIMEVKVIKRPYEKCTLHVSHSNLMISNILPCKIVGRSIIFHKACPSLPEEFTSLTFTPIFFFGKLNDIQLILNELTNATRQINSCGKDLLNSQCSTFLISDFTEILGVWFPKQLRKVCGLISAFFSI